MISVNDLSVQFTGEELFTNVSFIANVKERIGLVGKNGAGKTTLMKVISGEQSAETGTVVIPDDWSFGFLKQDAVFFSNNTVYEEANTAFDFLKELEQQQAAIEQELAKRTDYESTDYLKKCELLTELQEQFAIHGGHNVEGDIERVLLGLGFLRSDFDRLLSEFSSGWQMRVDLAKLLLRSPELLLLDEPTNHLDIESITWLEAVLKNYKGVVILVSHDRTFLDAVTTRTIEITMGRIFDYKANYSGYISMREERMATQVAARSNQQQEIAQIEKFIERFRYKNTKSKQVQSRVKKLEKMDLVEVDEQDKSHIHFRFPEAPHSGKIVVEGSQLSKNYGQNEVLKELEFLFVRGEKIAFVGKNGEGKTTLARMIVGELDYDGVLKLGTNVKIGYYAQNPELFLENEKTVFQTIDDVAVGDMRPKVKNLLGGFLFSGEDLDKKVSVLSGGEKSRLALAKLLLFPINLLVLDEPTNHLDMRSKDVLKHALLHFNGTIILVSHDRDFLDGLVEKVVEVKGQGIKEHLGGIQSYLDFRQAEDLRVLAANSRGGKNRQKSDSANKIAYEEKKRVDRERRKIQSRIEVCEGKITTLEEQVAAFDEKMSKPEEYQSEISSPQFHDNYKTLHNELNTITTSWEEWHEALDKLS